MHCIVSTTFHALYDTGTQFKKLGVQVLSNKGEPIYHLPNATDLRFQCHTYLTMEDGETVDLGTSSDLYYYDPAHQREVKFVARSGIDVSTFSNCVSLVECHPLSIEVAFAYYLFY